MSMIKEILQKIHAGRFGLPDALFLALLVAYVFSGMPLVPFHGDESTYIVISEDYDRLKRGEFSKIFFDPEGGGKQYLRLTTGSILAYSIGFARDITNNDDPIQKWLWGETYEENLALGNIPAPRLLNLARFCSTLMGALSIVAFFFAMFRLFRSRLIAWAGTLALATQGDLLVNIRRAMQEGPKFLFLILTVYFGTYVLQDLKEHKTSRWTYASLGIASGLTLAAKQDTVPVLVAVYLALGLLPIWNRSAFRTVLVNTLYLGAATILAYAVFLVFMPVFWEWWETALALTGIAIVLFQLPVWKSGWMARPFALAGILLLAAMTVKAPSQWTSILMPVEGMVKMREALLRGELEAYAGQSLTDPVTAKNRAGFLLNTMVRSRAMYMESKGFDALAIHEQIRVYEDSFLGGRLGSPWVDGLLLALALLGGWHLLRPFTAESLFSYILLLVTGILLFIMIPSQWQRYFLILQIPYSVFIGAGAAQAWQWGRSLARQ